jgi:hypothetical protein
MPNGKLTNGPRWKVRFHGPGGSRRKIAAAREAALRPVEPRELTLDILFEAIAQHVSSEQKAGIYEHLELLQEQDLARGRRPRA